jgi:hypothetical protein
MLSERKMNRRLVAILCIGLCVGLAVFLFPRWFAWHYLAQRESFTGQGIDIGEINRTATDVSIVRLIAEPNDYAEKTVRTFGFLHLEFEGNGIYLHREDYENGLSDNGLGVGGTPEIMGELAKLNDRYVLLEGTFSPGPSGLRSGAIMKVNRAAAWPPVLGGKK